MGAFAVCALARGLALVQPALGELASVEVPCTEIGGCVVAAAHHHRGVDAVEVCHAGKVALRAAAVAVAPLAVGAHRARRLVGHGVYLGSCGAVEYGKIFGTRYYLAARYARFVGYVRCLGIVGAHYHVFARAVFGARRGLAHHLRTAVAVEVIYHKLCVVCACAYILPQVDAPQLFACEGVAVDIDIPGVASLRVVVRVRRVPLHEYFVLAVAVDVAHAAIVGRVGIFLARLGGASGGAVEGDALVGVGLDADFGCCLYHGAVYRGRHVVFSGDFAAGVGVVGTGGDRGAVHFHAVAVEVECHGGIVGGKRAPRHEYARLGFDGYEAAVECFGLRGGGCCRERAKHSYGKQ